jgi:hypothetical protein
LEWFIACWQGFHWHIPWFPAPDEPLRDAAG